MASYPEVHQLAQVLPAGLDPVAGVDGSSDLECLRVYAVAVAC